VIELFEKEAQELFEKIQKSEIESIAELDKRMEDILKNVIKK
jgi:hypothetical protein